MKEIKQYRNLKNYISELQLSRLMLIANFVIEEEGIDGAELFTRTRKRPIAEARRKISFLARMHYNIEGKVIAKYLKVNEEWVCQLIYSAWDYCNVDKDYHQLIQKLMVKLQMYYNTHLKPVI